MEKRGLGKGLGALISTSMAEAAGEAHVREIPIHQIAANPMQPRTLFDPIKLEELTASIREHGVLQPILIRRVGHDKYQLLAGERRFRAANQAGLQAIPALIKECTSAEQLEIAIVENLQREDIGPIEAARAYERMSTEFNMTQEAIAKRVGKSRTAVTNTMGLLDLPQAVQDSLETGEISEGHARALKGLRDEQKILQAWEAAIKRSLSVRDTEKLVRELRNPAAEESPVAPDTGRAGVSSLQRTDPHEQDLINRLQELLKTRVGIKHTAEGAGKIEIEFYSTDDLNRILECILVF